MVDSSSEKSAGRPRREKRHPLPPELVQLLVPTLQVGAGAGTVGLFVGAASGIVRSSPPLLFALASGIQWFTLGSSYYISRRVVADTWGGESILSSSDRVKASAIAGGCAGMIGGLLRGPRNIVPGVIVFSMLGAGGQAMANSLVHGGSKPKADWLASKWSPVTPLSDKQYEAMLEEKLLRVEADIALVDENIQALRAAEQGKSDSTRNESKPTIEPATEQTPSAG